MTPTPERVDEAGVTVAGHTALPWFVLDFRATEMKRLGWTGPAVDRILITSRAGADIEAASGANCVIARIQFDNRPELLTDGNRADADFIVTACNAHAELVAALEEIAKGHGTYSRSRLEHACNTIEEMKALARAALAKVQP